MSTAAGSDFRLCKFEPSLESGSVSWMFLGYFGAVKKVFDIFEVKK